MPKYWLVKTEDDVYPIEQLKKDKETLWDCVRNYQARNYLKEMKKGDLVFIYHSNSKITGIAGYAEVSKEVIPDPQQFDKKSEYYDEKATSENPRWFSPKLKFKKQFSEILELSKIKELSYMKDSALTNRGNRLSVMPLSETQGNKLLAEFE